MSTASQQLSNLIVEVFEPACSVKYSYHMNGIAEYVLEDEVVVQINPVYLVVNLPLTFTYMRVAGEQLNARQPTAIRNSSR